MDVSVCIPCKDRSRMVHGQVTFYPLPRTVDSLVRAALDARVEAEIVVADYGSTDWPPAEWLAERARPFLGRVVQVDGEFSLGGGKNRAAEASAAPVLFFCEADMTVPAQVLTTGLQLARDGRAYFPCYQRERELGGDLYWGSGHGNCVVPREVWEAHPWVEGQGWAVGEDNEYAHHCTQRGIYVREKVADFIHRWHPLWESKVAQGGEERPA